MKLPEQRLTAFVTMNGQAEEAMQFYTSAIAGARIESIAYYGPDDPAGDEGKVLAGVVTFAGQTLLFMDMQAAYPAPPFNWAISLFIRCLHEAEFDQLFAALSAGGQVMMGPEPVLHMRKCAWVTDRFGVTWQLAWE